MGHTCWIPTYPLPDLYQLMDVDGDQSIPHHYLHCTCIAAVLLCPAALADWVALPLKPGQEVDALQAQGRILPGGGRGGSKPVQMLASDNIGRGLLGGWMSIVLSVLCGSHVKKPLRNAGCCT
jgi:hypothetical protein